MRRFSVKTPIEVEKFGILRENKMIIKRGLPIKVNKASFQINNGPCIKFKYLNSLTISLMGLCIDMEKQSKLTNLFGKPINWSNKIYEKEI